MWNWVVRGETEKEANRGGKRWVWVWVRVRENEEDKKRMLSGGGM